MITRVLDTNILLDRPIDEVIEYFEPCKLVIPFAVIKELDNFKTNPSDVLRSNSRIASGYLDKLRSNGSLTDGIQIPSGHIIQVELNFSDEEVPLTMALSEADYRILKVAKGLSKEEGSDVIVTTQDTNVRILADVLGLKSENFGTAVNHKELYTGYDIVYISDEDMANFARENELPFLEGMLLDNQYVCLTNASHPNSTMLGIYREGSIYPIIQEPLFGINAVNLKQRYFVDALLDPTISLVTCIGPAGTGKTLLSLAAALEQNSVLGNTKTYDKILFTRSPDPMGKSHGFLPGDEYDKMNPWVRGAFDNLDYLAKGIPNSKTGNKKDALVSGADIIMGYNIIDIQALTYIRGRSIPKQFIIIDEAQNLTLHEIKTIVTRAGKETKIILLGDIEQIDNIRLTANNNGLVQLIDAFKGQKCYAHVTLTDTERSELAELAAKLL